MKHKKRIAVFSRSTHYHFASGGMETQLKSLLEGLSKDGFLLTVFTTSYPEKMNKDVAFTHNGVKYVFIKNTTPGLYPMSFIDKFWKKLGQLDRKVETEGSNNYFEESLNYFKKYNDEKSFDLILSQSTSARKIIFETDLPSISIIHGTIYTEIQNRLKSNKTLKNWIRFLGLDLPNWIIEKITINRKFFHKVDKIVSVSDNLKRQFLEEYPSLDRKVTVIYNGVDISLFYPDRKKKGFTFLYIGRIDREKGVDIILDATKLLLTKTKKPFNVKIVGNGVHYDELVEYSKKLELFNIIKFVGQVDNELLSDYYKKASVFVFPTRREEGHPMIISESFCSGVPVIASAKGGLVNVIRNGVDGFLIDSVNAEKLSNKMLKLLNDKDLLNKLSKDAFEYGLKNFSQNVMISKYKKILESL